MDLVVLGKPRPAESAKIDVEVLKKPMVFRLVSLNLDLVVLGKPKPEESPKIAAEVLRKPEAF